MNEPKKQRKGFAIMSAKQRSDIARLGGQAVSRGRKGREHMQANGRKGGIAMHKNYKFRRAA